jgi:hypothetical protein
MNNRKWKRVNKLRQRYIPLFEKRLKRIFAQQGRTIIDALKNYRPEDVIAMVSTLISEDPIQKFFKSLYENVGVAFAKSSHRDLKSDAGIISTKQDEDELESTWMNEMHRYASQDAGKRIVSITGSSKTIAKNILSEEFARGIEEGLSIEEMTAKITTEFRMQWGKFAMFRTRRIVETEILSASNLGAMEGARSVDIPMFKVWMAGGENIRDYDNGSPFSHVAADGEEVEMDEDFIKSGEPMDCPGDPKGSPGNVINCKCVVGHFPKPQYFEVEGVMHQY